MGRRVRLTISAFRCEREGGGREEVIFFDNLAREGEARVCWCSGALLGVARGGWVRVGTDYSLRKPTPGDHLKVAPGSGCCCCCLQGGAFKKNSKSAAWVAVRSFERCLGPNRAQKDGRSGGVHRVCARGPWCEERASETSQQRREV